VLSPPRALLGVDLHDELVGIKQPGVDQTDEWQDIAPMVGNIQHPDVTHEREVVRVDPHLMARRVGDQQVKFDGDALEMVQDLGQESRIVDVHYGRNPGWGHQRKVGPRPPDLGVAGHVTPTNAIEPRPEICR